MQYKNENQNQNHHPSEMEKYAVEFKNWWTYDFCKYYDCFV